MDKPSQFLASVTTDMSFSKTYQSSMLVCPQKKCGTVLMLTEEMFLSYFAAQPLHCPRCRTSFDLWEVATTIMTQRSQLFRERGLAFLGARHAFFSMGIEPNQMLTVNLADYGVPASARVLYAVYTPCGGSVFPMEWRSNEMDRPRDRHKISLFGRTLLPDGAPLKQSNIDFSVTFIEHSVDEYALSNLALAYEHFLWDDYAAMVIPAFVAVEDTLKRVLDSLLIARGLPAAKRVPVEVRLSILLPLLSELRGLPKLPEQLMEHLSQLRRLRNDLGHEGRLNNVLQLDVAANLLCAAIFTYRYLKLLQANKQDRES